MENIVHSGSVTTLGVMLDCSRGAVYSVEAVKRYIDILSDMGYNMLQLYTEDTYEVEGEPYFGYLRGRYTGEELRELDAYAAARGVELIPCIQTLAHLGGIVRWAEYSECTDTADILLAEEERTYKLIDNMFRACAENFKSRRINIGMDEAHMVGLGKYLDRHGFENRFSILSRHLKRVCEIASAYGFRPMMWSDMFFRLANHGSYSIPSDGEMDVEGLSIPDNIQLVYWDYYNADKAHYDGMLRAHAKLGRDILFAGGAWCWSGFTPSNRFSIAATKSAVAACLESGVKEILITCWKDDGSESSLFSNLPTLAYAAEFVRGNFDKKCIDRKFKKWTGVSMSDFLALDLPDLSDGGQKVCSPSKYMLYSDPFLGIFDKTVDMANAEYYAQVRDRLRAIDGGRYGYVFTTIADLCDVLDIKYTLGVRTREAYCRNEKDVLVQLVHEYKELGERLRKFAKSFQEQWNRECKSFGFEQHDIRLGGLMRRVKHCRRRLEAYLEGKEGRIAELEEEILPFYPNAEQGKSIYYNDWLSTTFIKPKW